VLNEIKRNETNNRIANIHHQNGEVAKATIMLRKII